jgi:hypothetical protein
MKLLLALSASLFLFTTACSESTADEPTPGADVEDVTSTSIAGTYEEGPNESSNFQNVEVKKVGSKLTIVIDGDSFPLSRTPSGAFVFTSGDIDGECDDPGCSFRSKVNGVVFLDKENKNTPTAKLTEHRMHPFPESEEEIEGETSSTARWTKKR